MYIHSDKVDGVDVRFFGPPRHFLVGAGEWERGPHLFVVLQHEVWLGEMPSFVLPDGQEYQGPLLANDWNLDKHILYFGFTQDLPKCVHFMRHHFLGDKSMPVMQGWRLSYLPEHMMKDLFIRTLPSIDNFRSDLVDDFMRANEYRRPYANLRMHSSVEMRKCAWLYGSGSAAAKSKRDLDPAGQNQTHVEIPSSAC